VGPPQLISIDEARKRVLAEVKPLAPSAVPLADALGRVLREDAVAAEDLPPFDASAMDGFAVPDRHAGRLRIAGESRAGTPVPGPLVPGTCLRVSTGAVVPVGAFAVVPVERVEELGEEVEVPETDEAQNIRRAGEDLRRGEVAIAAGTGLGPAEIAVLASLGVPEPVVSAKPRIAVIATGDELVEPGEPLGPGQIRNSNAYGVAALARGAGAEVVGTGHAPDTLEGTRGAIAAELDRTDVLAITGGVSVGPHDHVKTALAELGVAERFWGVNLQPGKPTWFGLREGGPLVFGLPGNPVSAMVTFKLFAVPALRALQGADPTPRRGVAVLGEGVKRNGKRDQMMRVRLDASDGLWRAAPTKAQFSHVLSSMLDAHALARIPAGQGMLEAGERVDIEFW
jgi:molybdopterin molybdotransferase